MWQFAKILQNVLRIYINAKAGFIALNDVFADVFNVFDIGAMTIQGGEYIPSERIINHVDEFLKLMNILTGDKRYNQMENIIKKGEGGKISMCRILDEFENKGVQRGISQGIIEGEELMSKLIMNLVQDNRTNELEKVATDRDYRKQLYAEYNLT